MLLSRCLPEVRYTRGRRATRGKRLTGASYEPRRVFGEPLEVKRKQRQGMEEWDGIAGAGDSVYVCACRVRQGGRGDVCGMSEDWGRCVERKRSELRWEDVFETGRVDFYWPIAALFVNIFYSLWEAVEGTL